jgi:hypothetical protein
MISGVNKIMIKACVFLAPDWMTPVTGGTKSMIKSFISPDNSMYLAELWLNDLLGWALGFEKTGEW